ncbi:MAG: acetylglutamate kinase [Eggerthellaceae bacterium]|nr:acetylglutamate kinase [Eggerthellaceae bacterium]
MKFAKDTRIAAETIQAAEVLAEALPWIKAATGKTVLIKYGGSAMEDPKMRASVMNDIVLLKVVGVNPVIVHGGGKAISAGMKRFGVPVEFRNGLRVTTDEGMDVVRTILVGEVNQDLVRQINAHGNLAVGVSGSDAGTVIAEQISPDLGRVGRVTAVNTGFLQEIIAADYIPVVAGVALGEDGGYYNINADTVAGNIAAALGAHKIIFLTDVDGLYQDFDDKDSLISNMTAEEAQAMIDTEAVSTGMIPKLQSCVTAVESGVFRAHIINGTTPHALLLELLTDTGVGTVIQRNQDASYSDSHPIGGFASKLVENRDIREPSASWRANERR